MGFLGRSSDKLPTSLILFNDGRVIGHARFRRLDCLQRTAYIESVVVHPDFRGKGFGKLLMQKCEEHIKLMNFELIYLNTEDKQIFYGKLGYEECGFVPIHGAFCGETWNPEISAIVNNKNYNNILKKYFTVESKPSEDVSKREAPFPEKDLPSENNIDCDKNVSCNGNYIIKNGKGSLVELLTVDDASSSQLSSSVPQMQLAGAPPPPPPPKKVLDSLPKKVVPPNKIDNIKDKICNLKVSEKNTSHGKIFMKKYIAD